MIAMLLPPAAWILVTPVRAVDEPSATTTVTGRFLQPQVGSPLPAPVPSPSCPKLFRPQVLILSPCSAISCPPPPEMAVMLVRLVVGSVGSFTCPGTGSSGAPLPKADGPRPSSPTRLSPQVQTVPLFRGPKHSPPPPAM